VSDALHGVLRGGLVGCGFFARNHMHGWREVEGAEVVAVCDLDAARARRFAGEFGVRSAYSDVEEMLRAERLDFVDVVTGPWAHREPVEVAARRGVHVICQKPLASTLDEARTIVEACREARVRFMVHENFRWQRPMRELKRAAETLGELFFGRISFRSAYDVYADQPYLAEDPRFILYDLGVHLLDLTRFFFGPVEQLHCLSSRVNPNIAGEDAATVLLRASNGAACVTDMSYASKLPEELFPQTLVHLEGARGSATLGPRYGLTVTHERSTAEREVGPELFTWSTSPAEAIQQSVVEIQRHWIECLRTGREPETSGTDNLKTLELVFGSYASAEAGKPYHVGEYTRGAGS